MMNSDRSMIDTYRSYSITKPNPEAMAALRKSYTTLMAAFFYYPKKLYYYLFPPHYSGDEDDYKSFEEYLFIKFGMTYHINQKPLTPVSSYGTLEDEDENIEPENSIVRTIRKYVEGYDENDEFDNYIHEKYSRSVSSPY